jgi:hypothetical protein
VGAVVVGFDRHFNYYKIQYAQLAINENQVLPHLVGRKRSREEGAEGLWSTSRRSSSPPTWTP